MAATGQDEPGELKRLMRDVAPRIAVNIARCPEIFQSKRSIELHLSRTDILAIVAVVDIAIHQQKRPVKRGEIGPRHGLSERYFEPVLQCLSASGILTATRGKSGGYQLAHAPSLITAGDVLQAIRATQDVVAREIGSSIGSGIVIPALQDAEMALSQGLQRITIHDLVRSAESHIPRDIADLPELQAAK